MFRKAFSVLFSSEGNKVKLLSVAVHTFSVDAGDWDNVFRVLQGGKPIQKVRQRNPSSYARILSLWRLGCIPWSHCLHREEDT